MVKTDERIRQLQLLEQSMQALLSQKQSLQMQLIEIDSALKELVDAKEAYKIIGNIMVVCARPELESELSERKETAQLRIKSLEKKEAETSQKASVIQKEVLEAMKDDGKNG